MPLHVSSSMCLSSWSQNCIIQHLVSSHSVGGRPVHRTATDRCDDTRCCIIQFDLLMMSSSLCSLLHSPVSSSLLGPNIFLSIPLSNSLRVRSSLNVRDQVSHQYQTPRGISSCLNILSILWCTVTQDPSSIHYKSWVKSVLSRYLSSRMHVHTPPPKLVLPLP